MHSLISSTMIVLSTVSVLPAADDVGNRKSPQAVQEVLAGKRTVANAAWWGFDEEDSTDAIQGAVNSRAKTVFVPNVGRDWFVRPIKLVGNQQLIFEKGSVVTAKRGEYHDGSDSVFTAQDISNLTIRGPGATVRMQKEDYIVGLVLIQFGWHRWFDFYPKSENRMVLTIQGCSNVTIDGLTLRDGGGDGIFVGSGPKTHWCSNIRLKDVVCDNNYRQGISVVSCDGLTAENCKFNNTWGTPPSCGVDIEPDLPTQRAAHLVFRNCQFNDNYADGIEVFLGNLKRQSVPVSILFERCRVSSRRGSGMRVTKLFDGGPTGSIEFRDCVVDGAEGYGIKVQDKSTDAARVKFVRCAIRNAAQDRKFLDVWAPVALRVREPEKVKHFGGIEFIDCRVEDRRDRPAVASSGDLGDFAITDVAGTIGVKNPHGAKLNLGKHAEQVTLELKPIDR